MAPNPELVAEQHYLDRVYQRLEQQRERATAQLSDVLMQGGVTPQSVVEREMMAEQAQMRMGQLDVGHLPICFGRIDRDQSPSEQGLPGETFYIGRMGVWDEEQDPLVVDWRAPVAEPFYRATGRHPMGLARRRHFACTGSHIDAMEDEVFRSDALPASSDVEMVGAGALLAALERDRTGRMHDIVATVQREQDEIIRGSMHGVLVVQGGPGTGKTAVALHRAAYLLYTHRFPLDRQGVLVVGPNPLFLRYIDQVLPSLGETGVGLFTVDGLVRTLPHSHVSNRGSEPSAVARIKGDERMIKVMRQAVKDRERSLARDARIPFGAFNLTLHVDESAEIVNQVKRRPGTHNARRRQVEQLVYKRLLGAHDRALEQLRPAHDDQDPLARLAGLGDTEEDRDHAESVREAAVAEEKERRARLSRVPELAAALDRMWPLISPEELLHDLLGAKALVRLAARGVLSDDEADLLVRARSETFEEVPWTSADLGLIDELRIFLGKAVPRGTHADDEIRTYGHVIVDEAQDLSPMQLRVLARRSLGSMTIVGDIAQASGHWTPSSWDQVLAHLPSVGHEARLVELTVNYRTPGAIMDVAAAVLAVAAPDLRMPRSARPGGQPPRVVVTGDITASVVEAVQVEQARGGTLAIVCSPAEEPALAAALANAGIEVGRDEEGLEQPVALVPVVLAKGLEFDSVIVVEPTEIVTDEKFGLRALFVALTRATKRVTIVHSKDLPPSLIAGLRGSAEQGSEALGADALVRR
ncbi:MAG: ATP-binding domain-containing protein [Actinobacteria bacterium]|nr:ATP-binding domain-containing protein [Actinomycetota bacterium]